MAQIWDVMQNGKNKYLWDDMTCLKAYKDAWLQNACGSARTTKQLEAKHIVLIVKKVEHAGLAYATSQWNWVEASI